MATFSSLSIALSALRYDRAAMAGVGGAETTDPPAAAADLQLQQAAYQVLLTGTTRVMQPSLADFLR